MKLSALCAYIAVSCLSWLFIRAVMADYNVGASMPHVMLVFNLLTIADLFVFVFSLVGFIAAWVEGE